MYGEAKKLHLIEEILKIEDEKILNEVETVITRGRIVNIQGKKSFKDFAGLMSEKEVNDLGEIIEEGCEQIYPDDWK